MITTCDMNAAQRQSILNLLSLYNQEAFRLIVTRSDSPGCRSPAREQSSSRPAGPTGSWANSSWGRRPNSLSSWCWTGSSDCGWSKGRRPQSPIPIPRPPPRSPGSGHPTSLRHSLWRRSGTRWPLEGQRRNERNLDIETIFTPNVYFCYSIGQLQTLKHQFLSRFKHLTLF